MRPERVVDARHPLSVETRVLSLTTAVDTSILAALGRDNVIGRHYEEGSQEESFREKD
jgi:hypothetical protein